MVCSNLNRRYLELQKLIAEVTWNAEICKSNAISTDLVEKYAPESMAAIFPS